MWKAFAVWRTNVKHCNIRSHAHSLEKNLFVLNPVSEILFSYIFIINTLSFSFIYRSGWKTEDCRPKAVCKHFFVVNLIKPACM